MIYDEVVNNTNTTTTTTNKRGEDLSSLCRICREREETISHIVTEFKKLAQKEPKRWRNDQVGKCVHWSFCQKFGFDCSQNWYDHGPKPVEESEGCKLLCSN